MREPVATAQGIRTHQIRFRILLTITAAVYVSSALAQTPPARIPVTPGAPSPALPLPGIQVQNPRLVPPGLTPEEADAFKKDFVAYQDCRRDKADAVRLSQTATQLIAIRDHREMWEAELARNASLRSNIGSYDQGLAMLFALYRSLGGTASTVDAVVPVQSPCMNPWETLKRPSVPLTDHKQMDMPGK